MNSLPNKNVWNGRIDNDPSSLRYHQVVGFNDIDILPTAKDKTFTIIGFACDEGVRRNQGQVGAALAPDKIRKALANLPFHHTDDTIIDVGNITCKNKELERAQKELGNMVNKILNKRSIPMIIGGGHETLYGHYLGVREFAGPGASLGIINIDAHFDLRDDDVPSSGTMFHQILSEDQHASYICLGIQELGNTKVLFDTAEKFDCKYVLEQDISDEEYTLQKIDRFSEEHDFIMLTLCTDSITSSSAPGVSAPSPYGLEPKSVRNLLQYIAGKENMVSFDLSEVNPLLDENNKTVRLAGLLLADVMRNFKS